MVTFKKILSVSLLFLSGHLFASTVTCTPQTTKSGLKYCTTLTVGSSIITANGTSAQEIWASVYNTANSSVIQNNSTANLFNDNNPYFMKVYNSIKAGTIPALNDVNTFYNNLPNDMYIKDFANYLVGNIK